MEEKAAWKADFVKRFESERKELITQSRIIEVSKYAEINRFEFENMSDESFDSFLNGLKSTFEARIKAEKEAEEKRIADEKSEKERIEAQRVENEKLKADAIEKDRLLQERIAQEEKERKEKEAEFERKLKKESDAKAKLEDELKDKIEAEQKAEQLKKDAELKAKIEAEKLAKAPIKKQLLNWVNSFEISKPPVDNEKSKEIYSKFLSFKTWSENNINNI